MKGQRGTFGWSGGGAKRTRKKTNQMIHQPPQFVWTVWRLDEESELISASSSSDTVPVCMCLYLCLCVCVKLELLQLSFALALDPGFVRKGSSWFAFPSFYSPFPRRNRLAFGCRHHRGRLSSPLVVVVEEIRFLTLSSLSVFPPPAARLFRSILDGGWFSGFGFFVRWARFS